MSEPVFRTVRGDVPASDIGPVLTHEHVFLDIRQGWDPTYLDDPSIGEEPFEPRHSGLARWYGASFRGNLSFLPDEDYELMRSEVGDFVDAVGSSGCLVDMTPTGVGQAPDALRRLSADLNFHIVSGCGFYVHSTHPDWIENASVKEIADAIQNEVDNGIADTDVLPGLIGEVGTSEEIQPCEERVLKASARVAMQNGLAINVHMHPPRLEVAMRILDILAEEGHDLTKTSVSHLDEIDDLDYHQAVLDRGVTTGFDSFGQDGYFTPNWKSLSDNTKMRILADLIHRGYEDQLVVAQDVCKKHHLLAFGGLGYAHVVRRVVPRMQENHGIDDAIIQKLLVGNPRRLFAITR